MNEEKSYPVWSTAGLIPRVAPALKGSNRPVMEAFFQGSPLSEAPLSDLVRQLKAKGFEKDFSDRELPSINRRAGPDELEAAFAYSKPIGGDLALLIGYNKSGETNVALLSAVARKGNNLLSAHELIVTVIDDILIPGVRGSYDSKAKLPVGLEVPTQKGPVYFSIQSDMGAGGAHYTYRAEVNLGSGQNSSTLIYEAEIGRYGRRDGGCLSGNKALVDLTLRSDGDFRQLNRQLADYPILQELFGIESQSEER